jgi:hypothetical protein
MPQSSVHLHLSSESAPSLPCWFAEVVLISQVLKTLGLLDLIQTKVRFARARFGQYEVIDFLAVLIGYALSEEPTLQAFYARLTPFAPSFLALFERDQLPHRSTVSRFLASLDRSTVEALRSLFEQDLVARTPFGSLPGGLFDRCGQHWFIVDVDGTKQAARQRALPQSEELPAAHRRFERVCAKGAFGRKRGQVGRTRTTVLQPFTHQWIGSFSGPGNGQYRDEMQHALQAITAYATACTQPLARVIVRVDGLYGNTAPITEILASHCGAIGRSKQYGWLDLPAVQTRLQSPPDVRVTHPESGTVRDLYDCLDVPLTETGPHLRLLVATHPAGEHKPAVGVVRDKTVYELFYTTFPSPAFRAEDVLQLYLHRGSFETHLADEDQEQDPDRWASRSACGQDCWQILSQWMWNLRVELGHHLSPTPMQMTEFAPAQVVEPLSYGPPQFARRSWTSGFAGSDFVPQADGTLRCPANHPLTVQERRPEHHGSIRVVYGARICHCRPCPLRSRCQEAATTRKPRQVSAVLWPLSPCLPTCTEIIEQPAVIAEKTELPPATHPVLWADWERCSLRRNFVQLLRSQTVSFAPAPLPTQTPPALSPSAPQTRSQRAHWRLSWSQRPVRNARPATLAPLIITLHGLPASFAQRFGFALVPAV